MLMSIAWLPGQRSIDTSFRVGMLACVAPCVGEVTGQEQCIPAVTRETLVMEIAEAAPEVHLLHVALFACCES